MNFAKSFRLNVGWISKCESGTMAISNMFHALLIYEISWALAGSLVWNSGNIKYWFLACCFLHQPSRWLIFYETTDHIPGNSLIKLLRTIRCRFQELSKKNLLFLCEVKAFKIFQDADLIFKGSIYLGFFFRKMAVL